MSAEGRYVVNAPIVVNVLSSLVGIGFGDGTFPPHATVPAGYVLNIQTSPTLAQFALDLESWFNRVPFLLRHSPNASATDIFTIMPDSAVPPLVAAGSITLLGPR